MFIKWTPFISIYCREFAVEKHTHCSFDGFSASALHNIQVAVAVEYCRTWTHILHLQIHKKRSQTTLDKLQFWITFNSFGVGFQHCLQLALCKEQSQRSQISCVTASSCQICFNVENQLNEFAPKVKHIKRKLLPDYNGSGLKNREMCALCSEFSLLFKHSPSQ